MGEEVGRKISKEVISRIFNVLTLTLGLDFQLSKKMSKFVSPEVLDMSGYLCNISLLQAE